MTKTKKKAVVEFIGESMRLGARILVAAAAVAEWGWLRGLGAAFAVLILEDAILRARTYDPHG